jgi:phosphinothricin acetyltransferase
MLSFDVRFTEAADMAGVCKIVNHYIRTAPFHFRTEPQAPCEWVDDWERTHARYPWLVAVQDKAILGVAYGSTWNSRAAYDWCAEVTVYVAHDAARQGVGRALYDRLLAEMDGQGYRTQIAVIALPNDPSVALHEAFGFDHAGTLREVGYKAGTWLDVGLWQRSVGSAGIAPLPIAPVNRRR